ncbi:biopolymer transporter ExbD [Brumimicrobium sp.]|uniref:biopolymer transporter ExbD n=1 Tax=Brumimicrobium sp. TaxID=2029867 RepID=UPI003A8CA82B
MKKIIIVLISLFIFLSSNAQEETIKDKLYTCMVNHYHGNNIDLNASLDTLENYLILNDILKSNDGNGKVQYYQTIIKTGVIQGVERTSLMDSLALYYPRTDFINNCIFVVNDLDSSQFIKSQFYQTTEKVKNDAEGLIDLVSVSKLILSNLSAKDFEHPYYRANMLLSFVMTSDREQAYIRAIPSADKVTRPKKKDGFIIDITNNSKLLVNDEDIDLKKLELSLLEYLNSNNKKSHILLIINTKTEYDYYLEIHSFVENVYTKFWDQISIKKHNLEFRQLVEKEQNEIQSRYPLRIFEISDK